MAPSLSDLPAPGCPQPVAHRYADVLHHRIVAVAINHASRAAIAYPLSSVEVSDIAEWPIPIVTAPQLQVPIQIEALPPRQASEPFRLATQVTLHILKRCYRILYRKLLVQRFDRLKGSVLLLGGEVDQRRICVGQIGRGQRLQRVRECHRPKAEFL